MKWAFFSITFFGLAVSLSAQAPLWDLAKDQIPAELNHGAIRAADGAMTIGGDNYFGVPATAFPDQKNFTVQVTFSFPELSDGASLNVLLKQRRDGEDTVLFWIATTPQTARRSEPGKPVDALGDKNPVVLRINHLSEQVMKEEGVEVIDMYSPLAARLELAAGDEYHWSGPAYKMISDAILAKTNEVLQLNGASK